MAPVPAGVILFANKNFEKNSYFKTLYMPFKFQKGVLGTRPGGAAAAIWAIWKLLSKKGYSYIANKIIHIAQYAFRRILEREYLKPVMKL